MNQILNTLISNTDLPDRVKNSLKWNGLEIIRDIIELGPDKIKRFRGIGKSGFENITSMLLLNANGWTTDITPEQQHTITFKAGHSITVESWVADEARRWISDQRLIFKNFTKDGAIVISINLSDVSFIQ